MSEPITCRSCGGQMLVTGASRTCTVCGMERPSGLHATEVAVDELTALNYRHFIACRACGRDISDHAPDCKFPNAPRS